MIIQVGLHVLEAGTNSTLVYGFILNPKYAIVPSTCTHALWYLEEISLVELLIFVHILIQNQIKIAYKYLTFLT